MHFSYAKMEQLKMQESKMREHQKRKDGKCRLEIPGLYGYIRDERSGMESYPYPVKEG